MFIKVLPDSTHCRVPKPPHISLEVGRIRSAMYQKQRRQQTTEVLGVLIIANYHVSVHVVFL